jgi:hypothetical protein
VPANGVLKGLDRVARANGFGFDANYGIVAGYGKGLDLVIGCVCLMLLGDRGGAGGLLGDCQIKLDNRGNYLFGGVVIYCPKIYLVVSK